MDPAFRGWPRAADAGAFLRERLGRPLVGLILGSGFAGMASQLETGEPVPPEAVPGLPPRRPPAMGALVASAVVAGRTVWVLRERMHLYEGFHAGEVAFPVAALAAAGAKGLVLTCAAGGLAPGDSPGGFAAIADHLNLTGDDPVRHVPPEWRRPAFTDLHDAYDPVLRDAMQSAAGTRGLAMREGVLAAVAGPCYETPAEIRALVAAGADLVSMSTVPEAIAARHLGLRVAALACIANRGAGLGSGGGIDHGGVLRTVEQAVEREAEALRSALVAVVKLVEGR